MKRWKIKTLGEIAEVQSGGTPLKARNEYWFGDIPWYSSGELNETFTQASKSFITKKGLEESNAKLFPKGSLLIGMYDTAALKMSILDRDAAFNQAIAGVKSNENIDLKFILLAIESKRLEILNQRRGVRQKNLSLAKIKNIELSVPPLSEQKWIVAILDEVFEGIDRAIANTEKNLIHARELFEGYLNKIFTQKGDVCEEKTLRDVSSEFGRGKSKHRPRNDPKLYGDSYPFIQTGDVRNCNHFITRNSQFYSEVGLAQSKLWPKGTICITIAANIAETGILGFDACFPDSIIGIVVDDKITSNNFVEYLLQSVKARIKAKGQGSAQDNINLATFENERFPFPSLEQQKNLVSKLNKLSSETQRLESIYRQKLTALNELKQSILQKAFTGELTANTANLTVKTAEEEIAA
jgi:type I restriction enzyme, S subunit